MANTIDITLQPVYIKNNYIYVPARLRSFFPAGQPFTSSPIVIESAAGSFTAELQFNSRGYI